MKNLKKSFIALIAAFAVSCGDPDLPVELFPIWNMAHMLERCLKLVSITTLPLSRLL